MPLCKACGKSPNFHHCLPFCPKCEKHMNIHYGTKKVTENQSRVYAYYSCTEHGKQEPVMKDLCPVCGAEIEVKKGRIREDHETPKYMAAEDAYVPFFQETIKTYEKEIKEHIARDRSGDWPSWEKLISEEFARGVFHDMGLMEAIIDDIVKGRHYE